MDTIFASEAQRPLPDRHPLTPSHRQRASFSRQAVFDAFGAHHGKALDQGKFADRAPGARMRLAPGLWFQRHGAVP